MDLFKRIFGGKKAKSTPGTEADKMATLTAKSPADEVRQFTLDFFATFNSQVAPLQIAPLPMGRQPDGTTQTKNKDALRVTLSPELTEYFGRDELYLTFLASESQSATNPGTSNGLELVAYGSRLFDRMTGYLERRSASTVLRLPNRYPSSDDLLRLLQPRNASIRNLRMHEQTQYLFAFIWRLTYRADDKREELYTVIMDESGARLQQSAEILGAEATTGNETEKRTEKRIDIQQLLNDGEAVTAESDEEGNPLPPKLPPLTHLTRLAESARKYAVYHADIRCAQHEKEILPRLHKVLTRLTTFYQQQIEELTDAQDPEREKRRTLDADLQRKINEEVENHRLRVLVDLSSYAALQVPVASAELTLSDGKGEATVRIQRNRYSGTLRLPTCHVCAKETASVVLDRNQKICCDACMEQCATCLEIVSGEVCVQPCPVCQKNNCATCRQPCAACSESACHPANASEAAGCIAACPVCRDAVCYACQAECAHCGVRQCRSHLRADAVLDKQGETRLICASCAIRCPNCRQYSAQTELCSISGQRFCRNCIVTCAGCGRSVGPNFAQLNRQTRKFYCTSCET